MVTRVRVELGNSMGGSWVAVPNIFPGETGVTFAEVRGDAAVGDLLVPRRNSSTETGVSPEV